MERLQQERPNSPEAEPEPIQVSMKRSCSTGESAELKDGKQDLIHQQRPDSPVPSFVSMKSDRSMGHPISFKDEHHSVDKQVDQETPEAPTGPSARHQTDLDSIFLVCEFTTHIEKQMK
ncbi:uncharacterized protein ABDE67_010524 [Symphorus nematophorus]